MKASSAGLGTVKMFEAAEEDIPIYVDYDSLVRYHFGVFAFTGGGKSNLVSNILRRILIHMEDTKIVIFDINCEYPFLLMDMFTQPNMQSRIILESRAERVEDLYNSVVKPKRYETDPRVPNGLKKILDLGRVSYLRRVRITPPSFSEFLASVATLKSANAKNPHYVEALEEVEKLALDYMQALGYLEDDEIDRDFVHKLINAIPRILEDFKIHPMSTLLGWFESRSRMFRYFEWEGEKEGLDEGYTPEMMQDLIEGDVRLICISISDPTTIKRLVMDLTQNILRQRKRKFKGKPYVLFVWDEAQEFVANPSEVSGIDRHCSEAVERLLRQGRKYGLGGCIATQQIAHLNTSALQQLHTYFVSTLPRPYDRGVVSNTFKINKNILEKTLEFAPGEWLLSSYIATGMENVPIFIKADNVEDDLEKFLGKM